MVKVIIHPDEDALKQFDKQITDDLDELIKLVGVIFIPFAVL